MSQGCLLRVISGWSRTRFDVRSETLVGMSCQNIFISDPACSCCHNLRDENFISQTCTEHTCGYLNLGDLLILNRDQICPFLVLDEYTLLILRICRSVMLWTFDLPFRQIAKHFFVLSLFGLPMAVEHNSNSDKTSIISLLVVPSHQFAFAIRPAVTR